MNSKKHTLSRKLLATLITAAMLITMLPSAMFAVEPDNDAASIVAAASDSGTEPEQDSNGIGVTAEGNAPNESTGDTQSTTPDNGSYMITPGMTQDEVDAVVENATGEITIKAGNYGSATSHIQIKLQKGDQTVRLEQGTYNRLMIVVLNTGNTLVGSGATIDGDLSTVNNQSPAIYIPYGELTLQGALSIIDHDYGVILGYTNAKNETSTLKLAQSTQLNITGCKTAANSNYDNGIVCAGTAYFSYVDSQGDGTRGSAITTKGKGNNTTKILMEPGATLNATKNYGAGIFSVNVKQFILDVQSGATANLNENGQGLCMNTDYTGNINVNLDGATLNIKDNKSNGITGQSKPYVLSINNKSRVDIDGNGGIGINNFYILIDQSTLNVSNSGSHGASNVSLDATNSTITCNGNEYLGLNITKYNSGKNSTTIAGTNLQANDNGGAGIRFYIDGGTTTITDSTITANNNGIGTATYGYQVKPGDSGYWAGILGKGNVTFTNSVVYSDSAGGYSLYNTKEAPATLRISGTDVVVLDSIDTKGKTSDTDVFDDWNSSQQHTGRLYVTGGSLQADSQKMTKSITPSLNQLIPEVKSGSGQTKNEIQYGAPINDHRTALTRFDLHQSKNTVVNSDETNTFTVYDPNGESYDYTFRYNKAGEDLSTGASGNAYVWAPVTILHYDATEGSIAKDALGSASAGDVALTNTRGDKSALCNQPVVGEDSYIDATDYTICGNSLALSEGTLPTAARDGYSFAGWYYVTGENVKQAAELAKEGKYTELYQLLEEKGQQFDATTLTNSDDDNDLENITLYAMWNKNTITISPVDLTIYKGGSEGYDSVVDDKGDEFENTNDNSLPQPIFEITSSDGTTDFDGITFKDSTGKSWKATRIKKIDGSPSDYYALEATGVNQDPVRVTYKPENGDPVPSDEFDISEVQDLYTELEVQLYTGGVDVSSVTAELNSKTYNVKLGESGTLTVRTVVDSTNNEAVVPVTDQAPETRMEAGTGLIVTDNDTKYTVNNLGIPVPEGQTPSLLFDSIVTNDGVDRESKLEKRVADKVETGSNQTRYYQSQYLDLVDADDGNIWLKADRAVTVYWAYPKGTDASDDFTLWHFAGLHRDDSDNGSSGFDIDDIDAPSTTLENVKITKGENGISFTVEPGGFSPFVLTWSKSNGSSGIPDGGDTPDLNTIDHFSYIVGYPEDYRTGEPSDDESLWPVKPQGNITRAEVATIFYRLLTDEARTENWTQDNNFSDVDKDDWFNTPVSTLSAMGVISGYEDGSFQPNAPITRAEFAAIAVRFFEEDSSIYEEGTFNDVVGGEWFANAVQAAKEHGIIGGYPDGSFQPNKSISRAEACSIVNRTLDRIPDEDHLLPVEEMNNWPDNLEGAWYYADMQEATNGHEYEWITDGDKTVEKWTGELPEIDWDEVERELCEAHGVSYNG